jgi:hypothetical protein
VNKNKSTIKVYAFASIDKVVQRAAAVGYEARTSSAQAVAIGATPRTITSIWPDIIVRQARTVVA